MAEPVKLDRGVFTLSLDLELIWGTLDLLGPEAFRQRCEVERQVVIDRLVFAAASQRPDGFVAIGGL